MYRFFVEKYQIHDGRVDITGEDVNHIRNVLRMRPGEEVLISTGDEWEYTCAIERLEEDRVILRVEDASRPGRELASKIWLFQCLPKSDKMETVIQKAVELGAYTVVPVASSRCVVKLDERRAAQKAVRWNAIAEAAAKQSKRLIIPEVRGVMRFRDALEAAADLDVKLIPYERQDGMEGTRKILNAIRPGQSVAVMIGPEGGFDDAEVQLAREHGFEPVTLGKRILRTETAGMTMLSILMYLLEQD
ncbi:MAG: 16S rRNA (uracil(1498)-N(3))-methyltransferase [Lachnospiraceae bacterium]|nr:16S rRNA (uracil(1498)-N(3))-methyltransferase [Lachnospiraceae bacterium]